MKARAPALGRRAALALPLGLAGCSWFQGWFGENKPPLAGEREPVMTGQRGLQVDADPGQKIVLPPPVRNDAWPQTGGNPTHLMGHLALPARISRAWRVDIGQGGGYRRKILAQPLVAGNLVYAMDSDAVVSAFALTKGARAWRRETTTEDDDSTNIGGGMAVSEGTLYTVNGLGQLVAFEAATGKQRWRKPLGAPARSAPMVAEGRLFVVTIEDKLLALSADDGHQLWSHQAATSSASMLGQPAPAYADGLVVAGFGSGELATLRADTGNVSWTDSLASVRGRNSISDLSAIRGLPVIVDQQVYSIGLGGLMLSNDLRSGRRLWTRDVAGEDSPWAAGDWLFVISAEQRIAAVNRQDGRVAWVTDLPPWKNMEDKEDAAYWFGPVLAGDRLIAAGTNGEVIAVNPYTGAITGHQTLPDAASLAPVVAAGTAFIVTDGGDLLAFR